MACEQQKLISHDLEAGKFKIKLLADLVSGEGLFSDGIFSSHAHMVREVKDPSWTPLIKALISLMGALFSLVNHLSKVPTPNTTTLAGATRISICEF